ncbi:glycine cleavage system protein H [Anaeromyxobacter terrae]|uniref:glycine cleavage system protein H n=1 Tax=Anaeromyxobacter terrae TaxID=2925406 RepID=UPI001F5A0CCE|nr:glycine cleavage system protein H [Anaeromyxobacter sp. SG22]
MTTFVSILEVLGSFLLGVAARSAVFLAGLLALALPALLLAVLWRAFQRRREASVEEAGGLSFRRGAYYAPNHTWLAPAAHGLRVGLDDFAQRLLPSASAVELPRRGMQVRRGDPVAVVRAGGRTIRITAPVDGRVLAANGTLRGDPGLVKREPYGRGWLFALAPSDGIYMTFPQDREGGGWLRRERDRLDRYVEEELGLAAADGGALPPPAPSTLGEDGWQRVLAVFLRAA